MWRLVRIGTHYRAREGLVLRSKLVTLLLVLGLAISGGAAGVIANGGGSKGGKAPNAGYPKPGKGCGDKNHNHVREDECKKDNDGDGIGGGGSSSKGKGKNK